MNTYLSSMVKELVMYVYFWSRACGVSYVYILLVYDDGVSYVYVPLVYAERI